MSALMDLVKELNKGYGESLFTMGNLVSKIDRIPFSSPRLNYMTYGGLPRGRLVEFAGEPGGGKTTTSLDLVANAQQLFQNEYDVELAKFTEMSGKLSKQQTAAFEKLKQAGPRKILFIDAENTLDEEWAERLGVQTDKVIFFKPQQQAAEEIFEDVIRLISTDELGLVVLDSIGCLVSAQAWEKTVEERTYGGIAMPLTLFSRKAAPLCAKYKCTFVGINQIRDDMNSKYGGVTTTGGKGWKHNCSVRFMFRKGELVDENGDRVKNSSESPIGNKVLIDIEKTKCFRPDRRVGFYILNYCDGIDVTQDIFDLAITYGMINKTGGWYTFTNPKTGEFVNDDEGNLIKINGKSAVLRFLNEDIKVRTMIESKLAQIIEDDVTDKDDGVRDTEHEASEEEV